MGIGVLVDSDGFDVGSVLEGGDGMVDERVGRCGDGLVVRECVEEKGVEEVFMGVG